MKEHEDLFRDVPLLARLRQADLRALASRGRLRSYPHGRTIFREGAPGDALHIIVDGSVRVAVHSSRGTVATVALLGPGEFLGDLALLDGLPRSASAIAARQTRTLVVTRQDFIAWLSDRPAAARALLEALSLRIRRTDEALTDLTFLDLPHRLAKRLLHLGAAGSSAQTRGDIPSRTRLAITQSDLASMLGVSRESVNKQLNAFAREGWIALGRGSVTLLKTDALRDFA